MDFIGYIFNTETLASVLVLAFAWNAYARIHWNIAWQPPHTAAPKIPERCWTYDMGHLKNFALHATRVNVLRRPAMDYYVRDILLRSDLAFAAALTARTMLG